MIELVVDYTANESKTSGKMIADGVLGCLRWFLVNLVFVGQLGGLLLLAL